MANHYSITELAENVDGEHVPSQSASFGGNFLPCNKLSELVTRDQVQLAFRRAKSLGSEDLQDLVDFVLDDAKRIFLILAKMSEENDQKIYLLRGLHDDGVCDASLPIDIFREKGEFPYGYSIEDSRHDTPRFTVFQKWKKTECDLFMTYQWTLTAPVFDGSKFRFKFYGKRILPYLTVAAKPSSSGFFGEVSRVEIHSAHIPVWTPDPRTGTVAIAVKKAKDREDLAKYFDKEADNLEKLRHFSSPHLIEPIAAYQIGQDRCLIFPWASGGNLGDYWKECEEKSQESNSVKWIVRQFVGICSVLEKLHDINCRHGDLKPENILWFRDDNDMGKLQIADLGLAKFHDQEAHTNVRQEKDIHTSSPSGTSRYEPPEMDQERRNRGEARSRRYDVWSMGCIMFELLIWLTSGYQAVEKLRKETEYFWKLEQNQQKDVYVVHPYVVSRMDIMGTQLLNNTAYKELLHLVRTKLLVVDLSETSESPGKYREFAKGICLSINDIQKKCQSIPLYLKPVQLEYPSDLSIAIASKPVVYSNEKGLTTPTRPDIPRTPQTLPSSPTERAEEHGPKIVVSAPMSDTNADSSTEQISSHMDHHHEYNSSKQIDDDWKSIPDNNFAFELFKMLKWNGAKPGRTKSKEILCSRCEAIDSTQLFHAECDLSSLNWSSCNLCALLFRALEEGKVTDVVTLRQNNAVVGVEGGPNLLSIYVEPSPDIPQGAQLGLPWLFKQGSLEQLTLLREWIRVCDEEHDKCRRDNEEDVLKMPTRLIEVGTEFGDPVRLVESASIRASPYVALSHCWGPPEETQKFCTFKHNVKQLMLCIEYGNLPPMFRDTLTITRGLGVKYVWIDSLCIIQDDDDDWQRESVKMERVFSDAYCTIGASSARSSLERILIYRHPRPCVQLQTRTAGTLYVCPVIDDFHKHVELAELNRRGWVLQERALSRRSIYFTSTQVYWECGNGVHCETLARLQNSKAALLGDANFPKSALEYYRDGRQVLIQDLYERYSGLAFTQPSDRHVAILGLQQRLARAFRTKVAYGCFQVYFARGILWYRRDERRMKRIRLPAGHYVPTWSMFSKEGPIKYMDLKFKEVHWATGEDFKSPFDDELVQGAQNSSELGFGIDLETLRGLARSITMTSWERLNYVIFDEEGDFEIHDLRCVVIGRDKVVNGEDNPKHHVLIIQKTRSVLGNVDIYERVGVASLRQAHVGREGTWVIIR